MYYSGSLTEQSHVKVAGSKSRSSLRSEWVLRRRFDLTAGESIDTAVCMKQQTGDRSLQCVMCFAVEKIIM